MAFNFAAFASGFAEEVSESIDEDSKRVKLILDKAWDKHTERFISKRDKEEKKAVRLGKSGKQIRLKSQSTLQNQVPNSRIQDNSLKKEPKKKKKKIKKKRASERARTKNPSKNS